MEKLVWRDPIAFARQFSDEEHLVFLHNGLPNQSEVSNNLSLLALGLQEEVTGGWDEIETKLSGTFPCWENAWFGWLSYELKNQLESFSETPPSYVAMPQLWFGKFRTIYIFDHSEKKLHRVGAEHPASRKHSENDLPPPPHISQLQSNMTRDEYLSHVSNTIQQIHSGEFYQANITRKFFGQFDPPPNSFSLFASLCSKSPGAYSAYIKLGARAVISSSPECFLTIDANGHAITRPIKGTIARGDSPETDRTAYHTLQHSVKDKAENLMIVDLMRNDMSRACQSGSIKVDQLYSIQQFSTLYHMISTISGNRAPNCTSLDLVKSCFPPGSMTGAPKISAIEWCSECEQIDRGLYSGAIGWFGGDGSCDLSVVIRTLIVDGNQFEFQVGGGIVADSQPENEWHETITKARGIMQLLGIAEAELKRL